MKKILLIIIGGIVVISLIAFNHYTRNYFDNNDKIIKDLNLLNQKELMLNYEIFTISVYLYKNFDYIVKLEKEIDSILESLSNNREFKNKRNAYKDFLEYKKDIKLKIQKIYELEIVIAPLKNADMFVSELIKKLPYSKLDPKYRRLWLKIASNIFLAKSSLDKIFIRDINQTLKILKKVKNNSFNEVFMKNVELINKLFPIYVVGINNILNSKTQEELNKCFNDFLLETNSKLRIITIVSILLIIFVIASILLILYLFFALEKENELLKQISITDSLTNLYNRRKLEEDIKLCKKPLLFLVNIDRFKYYNDFYGNKVGDFILKETAKYLRMFFDNKYSPQFYRIGADDFCILIKYEENIDIKHLAKNIIDEFKLNPIVYDELEFHIFVSIGISYFHPIIETADIALKKLKKMKKNNILIYNPNFQEEKKIEENIIKTSILKKAIENNMIIPYFQSIVSNKTGEIIKYEVLARIYDGEKMVSIYPFLKIAKENKVYKHITKMIYKKAFEKFKNKNMEFSLNISIDDIEDEEIMEFLHNSVKNYPKLFKYITFEILEDDAIYNYQSLKDFIIFIKSKGSKVAIDDFGSGYSNFEHILNLDIDYLKIDGSLIKNLDKDDTKMELIIETIVNFSKKTKIETIAEFLHSEKVWQKVKKLNIDYSQGYYFSKPKRDIE